MQSRDRSRAKNRENRGKNRKNRAKNSGNRAKNREHSEQRTANRERTAKNRTYEERVTRWHSDDQCGGTASSYTMLTKVQPCSNGG